MCYIASNRHYVCTTWFCMTYMCTLYTNVWLYYAPNNMVPPTHWSSHTIWTQTSIRRFHTCLLPNPFIQNVRTIQMKVNCNGYMVGTYGVSTLYAIPNSYHIQYNIPICIESHTIKTNNNNFLRQNFYLTF